jgi:hypothetical protein
MDKDSLPFGKRYGHEPINIPFQVNDIDKVLRVDLWNAFYIYIIMPNKKDRWTSDYSTSDFKMLHRVLWAHYFKRAIDDFPVHDEDVFADERKHIEQDTWYKVYQFFEFLLRTIQDDQLYNFSNFVAYLSAKLKENNAGYVIISNKFVPIINETEINEINKTKALADKYGLSNIQDHLNSSLELLSKKPLPDYRNSIKESISMVEVISRMIEPENTLGKALNKLEKNKRINSQFKAGFENLYAYTNGKDGIRHALMTEKDIDIEDAQFFLVACSACTNYLIAKAKKANLLDK